MNLSQTAILTKQAITVTSITLVILLTGFIGYKIWAAYELAHRPPVEEKPDLKFGQLPLPDFPDSTVSGSNFSYTIDTSTGNLPKVGIDKGFERISKVYFVIRTYATLLAGEKSKLLAEKFEMKNPPQILSEINYKFIDNQKSLDINLDNGNFVYINEATPSGTESLDDDNKLVTDFENYLNLIGVFKDEFKKGKTHVIHIKNADTEIAQISLWPPVLDNKPILTSQFDKSDLFAIVYKGADQLKNYLSLNFTYYPIDSSTFATYPTKSADIAFEDLKSGKGAVIIVPTKPQVSITSIYLGYFLSKNYSPYLQPIYVFEGPHFAEYVSAISEEFQSQAK